MFTANEIRTATFAKAKGMVKANLIEDDRWMLRGLLAIYARQTSDEQAASITRYDNDVGFNATDARILSSFARQYKRNSFLSIKQLIIARRKMPKYAGQLARIARESREPAMAS